MKYALLSIENRASRALYEKVSAKNPQDWTWIKRKEEVQEIDSFEQVFVFRWPHIIREELLQAGKFIGFHTSNLPHGRGGSPLQNQIVDGIIESKINAIELVKEIDAGPIYTSRSITLQGTIEDIWTTLANVASDIIIDIVKNKPRPIEQQGTTSTTYKRRRDNSLPTLDTSLEKLHRFVQMLDGEGYPRAFLEIGDIKIEFERASIKDGSVLCDARITVKSEPKT